MLILDGKLEDFAPTEQLLEMSNYFRRALALSRRNLAGHSGFDPSNQRIDQAGLSNLGSGAQRRPHPIPHGDHEDLGSSQPALRLSIPRGGILGHRKSGSRPPAVDLPFD
jgi:hypothetical protein